MRIVLGVLLLMMAWAGDGVAQAKSLKIFGAASVRYAMDELIEVYKKKNPDIRLEATYGSSGKAFAQIRNGAPYDLFFSADMNYPDGLVKGGFAVGETKLYSVGRIVLWQRKGGKLDLSRGLKVLTDPSIKKIAIANPEHAPYGVAAREALTKHGLWNSVQSRLVMGENISQATHFLASGAAEVGIIAHSVAVAPDTRALGEPFVLIDAADHTPLHQGYVVTKVGGKNPEAKSFIAFFEGPDGKTIMKKHGFSVASE